MEEEAKFSTSIKDQRPSSLNRTEVGHGISRMLEDLLTCKLLTPIQVGSKSSDIKAATLSTFKTTR